MASSEGTADTADATGAGTDITALFHNMFAPRPSRLIRKGGLPTSSLTNHLIPGRRLVINLDPVWEGLTPGRRHGASAGLAPDREDSSPVRPQYRPGGLPKMPVILRNLTSCGR
ncbi:hypothetical protein MMC07_008654 [Pseudocyphellaria aurata]|nr:hypothetical protein [Pseudocyphellaria aurata]